MINNKDLRENVKKSMKKIDIACEIYLHALHSAQKIVDEEMPYKKEIGDTTLPSDRYERMITREEAISAVTANLLQLSEGVRL